MLPNNSAHLEIVGKELTSEKLTECARPEMMDEEEGKVFLPQF